MTSGQRTLRRCSLRHIAVGPTDVKPTSIVKVVAIKVVAAGFSPRLGTLQPYVLISKNCHTRTNRL